jgi:hypothetical protein
LKFRDRSNGCMIFGLGLFTLDLLSKVQKQKAQLIVRRRFVGL